MTHGDIADQSGTTAAVDGPDPLDHHERVRLLGEVSTGGAQALLRVLHRAHMGEDPAAGLMAVSALLRALPMGSLSVHEMISAAGITERQRVAELLPRQRAALMRTLG